MKRTLHRTGASILAILLVAVTTGTTLFTHICFLSGEHRVSTSEISSCCAADGSEKGASISSSCCDDSNTFLKFSFTASNHRQFQPDDVQPVIADFNISNTTVTNATDHFVFRDLPPPDSGRDLLIQYSVFRI